MSNGNAPATPEDYRLIFEQMPAGAAIFDQLYAMFAKPAERRGGIDAVLETYHRLGARSVLDFIVLQINRANQVPDIEAQSNDDEG